MNLMRKLISFTTKRNGRNSSGKITVYKRGGGVKRKYRNVTFFRKILNNKKAKVVNFIYDPNRNVPLALLNYDDGFKEFILKPKDLNINDYVCCSDYFVDAPGNATFLKHMPVGLKIHNLEVRPFSNKTLIRAGNTFGTIVGFSGTFVIVKLPSKQIKLFNGRCKATVGILDSNKKNNQKKYIKAGINRLLGKRPTVRGSAMNPCDHPHGGGEGKAPIGLKYPKTPWGKNALGIRTSKKKKDIKYLFNSIKN